MDSISRREGVFADWIIIIIFLLFITFPEINRQLEIIPDILSTEKRTLALQPVFSIRTIDEYMKKFDAFYNDHFGFRLRLVAANTWLHVKLFGISSVQNVIIGKNDWLFFTDSEQTHPNVLAGWQGYNPYSLNELSSIQSSIEAENMWFVKQNITFLILPAPDKNSIYPEYLPWPFDTVIGPSRDAQIFEHMKLYSNVQLVDVRQALLIAKKRIPLDTYFKTDSHWNNFGAFIAYEEVMKRLLAVYPKFIPYRLEDFVLDRNLNREGDLAKLANLDVSNVLEHQLVLKPNITEYKKGPKMDKILIIGDSFAGLFFKDYFRLHFSDVGFFLGWRNAKTILDRAAILNYRPRVVIFESVGRYWTNT